MPKHRTFNADKFLDKFQHHTCLIHEFLGLWSGRIGIDPTTVDVPSFKKWLVEGEGEAKDELLEALYQIYDLCTERGHEDLIAAIDSDGSYAPDPEHALPVECLGLKLRTERDDLFNLAYARYSLFCAERFTVYKGRAARPIAKLKSVAKSFERKLGEVFKDHKNSDRVLLRFYEEGSYVNFIVYHEKRTRATLVFEGTKVHPKVAPHIYRPAQQDFISYNCETGQVEIEAGYENEETKLRKCFAEHCLGDAEFFEGEDAAHRISLEPLADLDFEFTVPDGVNAALVEVKFWLKQKHGPRMVICSKNVLETLELNGLRKKLDGDQISRAVIKITFPDDQRGKRVELAGPNRIKFKRATHAEDVFQLLREWGLLLEQDEDAAELRAASAAFVGISATPTAGGGSIPATGTKDPRTKPRAK